MSAELKDAIDIVIRPRERDLGGFTVRRVLPNAKRRLVGPFIFFDQMGPAEFDPGEGIDVRPHPHIGLATVTYLFDGAIQHRDSLGENLVIRPGDVNWMTAGHGVVHSERTPDEERAAGHKLYGIQTWVALPESDEEIAADFVHHKAADLPEFERGGVVMRLILGDAWGYEAPAKTYSPIFYLHAEARSGQGFDFDVAHQERAVYVVQGAVEIAGERFKGGEMAVIAEGADVRVEALEDSRMMLCGGAALGERLIWWNFVATSQEKMDRAKADWADAAAAGFPETGRFLLPAGETEHIPLPDK